MAKVKTVFICSECGYESAKWNGKCPQCGEWNTFTEEETVARSSSQQAQREASKRRSANLAEKITAIDGIEPEDDVRYSTGLRELDRVLGGGRLKGSLVLLGGEPGIGKSTLLLQICNFMGDDHTILYVSGEESMRQIKIRAERLGVDSENLYQL